jgi:hypothetical protein
MQWLSCRIHFRNYTSVCIFVQLPIIQARGGGRDPCGARVADAEKRWLSLVTMSSIGRFMSCISWIREVRNTSANSQFLYTAIDMVHISITKIDCK